jgi:hypothetical protein
MNVKTSLEDQAYWLMPVISATWEVKIRGPFFKASPGKDGETLLSKKNKVGKVVRAYNLSNARGAVRRIIVQGMPGQKKYETLTEK